MRFLVVVDDSSTMHRRVILTLQEPGHQARAEASSGRRGLLPFGMGDQDAFAERAVTKARD